MSKSYCSLGLMSGTSMDGVDASIIQSDGETKYKVIIDKYFEYPQGIYKDLTRLRDKIKSSKDLKKFSREVKNVEKEITLFHAKAVNKILKKTKMKVDFIGFHGQTIYHNAKKKISKQLGDGKLLSRLTRKTVVYDFRQNDLKNGGEGAPLTPIFHKLLVNQNKLYHHAIHNRVPVVILNIGGIANITCIHNKKTFFSYDVGPGNCMIDEWIRLNSKNKNKYDKNGKIAKSGKTNSKILNKMIEEFFLWKSSHEGKKRTKDILEANKFYKFKGGMSLDIKDFNSSFVKGLSAKDGAATLTEFTGIIITNEIHDVLEWRQEPKDGISITVCKILVCGGGRKNKTLMKDIDQRFKLANSKRPYNNYWIDMFESIDVFNIDGDFIESQAFAYLAIRSYLKLPISFPGTTGCKRPCTGGVIVKN